MRDNGAVVVRGEVLGTELKSGTAKSGNPYAFHIVSILTGRQVSEVTWPSEPSDDQGPVPSEGDKIEVEVNLGIYGGRQQIEPVRRVRPAGARLAPTGS